MGGVENCYIHRLGLFWRFRILNFTIFKGFGILRGIGHLAGIFGGHFRN